MTRIPAKLKGEFSKLFRNRFAAIIGPMVWLEDGPKPILNISKTDKNIKHTLKAP